ncbi:C-C chemokine receptor type 3-like [Mercenaria mercenaria]|uniref:C-C chemokine receptor type 3-like n=1 Tax=Mercenaria mercenaria TaxID=6596 RepID=UPI00234E70A5|nr:C-C chemokine receptor type 3-like [Mercenaria mercenaria]
MYYERKVALSIWRVYLPILVVVGTLGNLMTIIFLMQLRYCNSSIARYLTALAVSDVMMLWIAVPRSVLHFGYGIDIRSSSQFVCKVQLFYLLYLAGQSSAWFIVILTIERFISAWLPIKAKAICTVRRANIVILSLLAFFIVLNAHFLYGMGHAKGNMCYQMDDSYTNFYFYIWSVIQLSVFFLLPLTILMVINISIIIRVLITGRKYQTQVIPQALTTAARARKAKNYQITAMLIAVNVVYMICMTPILVFLTSYTGWVLSHGDENSDAVLELIWAIINALFYTNYAVNFILYFVSGSRFRSEVVRIFCQRKNSCPIICRWNWWHSWGRNANISTVEGNMNIELQNVTVSQE